MKSVVNFLMIVEMNEMLEKLNYDYTVHAVGGCASCGLELRCYGKSENLKDIINVINRYLKSKFMIAVQNQYKQDWLNVISIFDKSHK